MQIRVVKLRQDAVLPSYAHIDDAGADLSICEDVTLAPGQRRLVATGIAVEIPEGYAGFVHPRSGLAARHGLSIVNAPGTIDAGYRGEIKICLINTDPSHPITLSSGDKIAQLVIQRIKHAEFIEADYLSDSDRGASGHGSTGGVHAWNNKNH